MARKTGGRGVTGVLCSNFTVDIERTKLLIDASNNLQFTFHRAFDWVVNPELDFLNLQEIGVNYLLSSGAIVATHTLDTPSNDGAVLGSLEPTSQLTQSSSDIVLADNGYKFNNLKYSEAGSFNFEVAEDSNSFYGKILGASLEVNQLAVFILNTSCKVTLNGMLQIKIILRT